MGGSGAAGSLYDCMGRYRMFLLLFLFDWVNPSANNILIGSDSEGESLGYMTESMLYCGYPRSL